MRNHGWWWTSWWMLGVIALGVLAIAAPLVAVAGQESDATPPVDEEVTGDSAEEPVVTPTPVVGSASGQTAPQVEQEPEPEPAPAQQETTGPVEAPSGGDTVDPVLAQGLIYLSGEEVVWQVREVELSGSATVTGNARVLLQRSGTSVVRNDLTGKRARLEPGEAYFASSDDPYTTFPEGNAPSVVWIFEISNSNEVGEGAFYLSPNITDYGEAVYDYEFTRHIASPGDPATITGGDGPSMVMVLAGQVDIQDANGTASLTARDGLIVNGDATIEATGSEAVVVSMTVGPVVSDESAAPPAAPEDPLADSDASDDAQGEPVDTAAPADSPPPAQQGEASGDYVTSVRVGARESIGVTLYVDGVLMYDGWLGPGEWTAFYDGSLFEVYTTSGENTIFENSCGGEAFQMGYEPGDAYYVLEAGPSSCAPVGE